jgi:hypothetical protein
VVVLGDEAETKLAERVSELSNQNVVSLAGKTSVGSLSGVLARCKLLVTNDTGTAHIAAALKIPVIGIFLGPASAKDTAPVGSDHVILEANLPCAPCDYKKVCANPVCKSVIDAEAVYETSKCVLDHKLYTLKLTDSIKARLTRVDAEGQFSLQQIGGDKTSIEESLDFYRSFWISFLHQRRDIHEHCVTERVKRELSTGLAKLSDICSAADTAMNELKRLSYTESESKARVRESLEKQTEWQNSLRALIGDCPAVSPLCRFLLVKAVLARTSCLSDYQADLTKIVSDLHRGVTLMESLVIDRNTLIAPFAGEFACAES